MSIEYHFAVREDTALRDAHYAVSGNYKAADRGMLVNRRSGASLTATVGGGISDTVTVLIGNQLQDVPVVNEDSFVPVVVDQLKP